MTEYQHIKIRQQDQLFTVWLNRPEKRNAFNREMIAELTDAFQQLADNPQVRVILLRGAGKAFCAGADLNYMHEISNFGEEENKKDALALASLFEAIYLSPKPVIAVLHGAVFGGANGLSAACDIVLADEHTKFSFSEVKLGITPATISPYVIARCGQAAARDLMLTGRQFGAEEAFRFMLVNSIFNEETLQPQLEAYCGHLLFAGPNAVTSCKQLIREVGVSGAANPEIKELTATRIAEQRATAEAKEGIQAFFEKRPPNWTTS